MAKIEGRPKVELVISFTINEAEAYALDALVGYGDDSFCKAFYEKLGEAYMKQHEAGLRLFFTSIREQIPPLLASTRNARLAFAKSNGDKHA